ncbi:MAG: type II toxin-antitoxin system Phd/YefM family antitoxin [Spirochaetes bacterium]|nr:type II toxin-antitoxin system Phd/YefM family antitoxin [Spirochaetota bacterium]
MSLKKDHNVWQIAGAKAAFSQVISRAADKPQIIKKRDKSVAAIVSMADFKTIQDAKAKWRDFVQFSQELVARDDNEMILPARKLTPPQF